MVTRRCVTVRVSHKESCVTLSKILRVGRSVVTLTNCDSLAENTATVVLVMYCLPHSNNQYHLCMITITIVIISGDCGLMGLLASHLTIESQFLFNLSPFVSLLTLNFSSSFRTFKMYCSDYNGKIRIQTVYKAHVNEQFGNMVDQLTSIFPLYEQLL